MGINNIPAFADNFHVLIYIPALGRFQKQKSFIINNIPALFFDFFEVAQARVLTFPLFSGGWPLVGPNPAVTGPLTISCARVGTQIGGRVAHASVCDVCDKGAHPSPVLIADMPNSACLPHPVALTR
jgi:hypothetical protein